jgi:PAS domain S-box-containing protein
MRLTSVVQGDRDGTAEAFVHLKGLFEPMAEGLAFLELADDSVRINKKLARMLGYAIKDLRSSDKLRDLVLPKAGLGNGELLEIIGRRGELICHETQLARKNGDKINVVVNAEIVCRRLDGNHVVVLSVADSAARKTMEDRMRQRLHNLSTHVEALEDRLRASRRDLRNSNVRIRDCLRKIVRMKKGVQALCDSVEEKRSEVTRTIEQSLDRTVQPIIDHLMSTQMTEAQKHLLKILDFNIKHIATGLGVNCSNPQRNLTPRETQICHMIREGMNSREIAAATGLTFQTIITHRKKIRKKLGIAKAKLNLEMYIRDNVRIDGEYTYHVGSRSHEPTNPGMPDEA